jgi:hypothetical protein
MVSVAPRFAAVAVLLEGVGEMVQKHGNPRSPWSGSPGSLDGEPGRIAPGSRAIVARASLEGDEKGRTRPYAASGAGGPGDPRVGVQVVPVQAEPDPGARVALRVPGPSAHISKE